MNKNRCTKPLLITLMLGVLACCLSSCKPAANQNELQNYLQSVQARTPTPIESVPALTPTQPFIYTATHLRSPFIPASTQQAKRGRGEVTPNQNRRKEPLEAFPVDALKLVGMMNIEQSPWALVLAPDQTLYRVTIGNYIGKDYGKIIVISKNALTLKESIADGRGGWRGKKRIMSLDENSND